MRAVRVGLVGFGTIGAGVARTLLRRKAYLRHKNGFDIELKAICDKDLKSNRGVKVKKSLLTKDLGVLTGDPEIDIIVELVGGIHPAKEIIKKSLAAGKFIVTANKALLSECGEELFDSALRHGRCIRFEGAVGGGIPIVEALKRSLSANHIESMYGIVNGTSNYVLWKMQEEGCDFREALADAKNMGFAERDPTLDVNGTDSAHKLALMALLGFGKIVPLKYISVEGISGIQPCDIEYARGLGYCVKLLAITKRSGDEIELRVHPTLLSESHPLSAVRGVNNAIYVKGDLIGDSLFYGKGAGRYPTSSAIVADVIDIARSINHGAKQCDCNMYYNDGIKRIRPEKDIVSRYYVRFQAIDRTGVLASISSVLSDYKISIASVKQIERRSQKIVPIIMLTHDAREEAMSAALRKIGVLGTVRHKPVAIKIENL